MRRLRRTERGPTRKTEKPDLNFLPPPRPRPFPNLRKQLVQRVFLPRTAFLPLSAPAFSEADPDCGAYPTSAVVQRGRPCWTDGCHSASPLRFSVCLRKETIPPAPHIQFEFIFLLPASFLKALEISDKNMNGTVR